MDKTSYSSVPSYEATRRHNEEESNTVKIKVIPQQAEVAQGVPG
jgi:hypothetical protein